MAKEIDSCARLDALMAEVKKSIKPGMDEEVQTELGKLMTLLPELEETKEISSYRRSRNRSYRPYNGKT